MTDIITVSAEQLAAASRDAFTGEHAAAIHIEAVMVLRLPNSLHDGMTTVLAMSQGDEQNYYAPDGSALDRWVQPSVQPVPEGVYAGWERTPGDGEELVFYTPVPVEDPPTLVITGGYATCSACGSDRFTYEESHPSTRQMADNDGNLTFHGDFSWFDGDDTPGVTCEGCGEHPVVPESIKVEIG
jgi:hypothetical protein